MMSDWSLDELECAIRTGLRWDKDDTARLDAGISTGWRLATMQGTTVLMSEGRVRRDLEARAKLLETALGWAANDEHRRAVLEALAAPYIE
jgi:hypothetical protein